MLRGALLAAGRSARLQRAITAAPPTRAVVSRFVSGEGADAVVETLRSLTASSLLASIDHLGEDVKDLADAEATAKAYTALLTRIGGEGLAEGLDVSVKLSAVGQALGRDGDKIALDNARLICESAQSVQATVTLDMEDHTTTDSTLSILSDLRQDFPWVGAVLQAYLHRTEADCRDLATSGSRVRLCKGAYREPAAVAFQSKIDVDRSFVRCLRILIGGAGYPMIATHDPRLIEIAGAFVIRSARRQGSYEYQMLLGVRPEEQRRLAARGERVRVYVPYGSDWYGYLMRRMAERPANVAFFLRALASKR
jgi:proline dehydrogenase